MLSGRKPSVAIVHPRLGRGGSEARVMWGAEALKRDFAVSIISTGLIDLGQLDRFYGTAVANSSVRVVSLPIPWFLTTRSSMAALRGAFYQRRLRRLVSDYAIPISAYNMADFGIPGIHCLADFSWCEDVRTRLHTPPPSARRLMHRSQYLRSLYLAVTRRIAGISEHDIFAGNDLILANSRWTATIFREKYGIEPRVLYPPVLFAGDHVPIANRAQEFVCIGRISPEKRIERIVDIIDGVRQRGHGFRLRIIGALDDSPYVRKIRSLAQRHSQWVVLEGLRFGTDKAECLSRCCYGIHACEGEAFGIAVAEMVKAGCITFAPAEGGPAEILDHDVLLYRDEADAVDKITAVIGNERLRAELAHHLEQQAEKFSEQNFMSGLRAAVERFIQSRSGTFASDEGVLLPNRSVVP